MPSGSGCDDGVGVSFPSEWLRVTVVLSEVAVDGGLEVDDPQEGATSEPALGEGGEEAFHGVQPGGAGRGEVEGDAWVAGQPGDYLGVLVGGVVVEDDMHGLGGRDGLVDVVEEADELLMPVALHASSDNLAVQHVERREQRRRAMPDVVVGHGPGPALL